MKTLYFVAALLILLLLTVGCERTTPRTKKAVKNNPANMSCIDVGSRLYRCENAEAVCYKYYGDALQCKWKDQ